MVIKYLLRLFHPTEKQKEEREKQSKLEKELEFLKCLSEQAKERPSYGSFSKPCKEIPGEYLSTQ